MRTEFKVKGMHCNSCKVLIEDVCNEIKGVKSCNVEVKTGKVVVEHDNSVDLNKVKKEIEGLGEYKILRKD